MLGLTTTRRLRAELAAARAVSDRLRKERGQLVKDRAAFHAAAVTASRQFTDADEKYVDVSIVNACLTDDLVAVRERLAACESGGALGEQMALYRAEKKRADRLQRRLDQALGLDDSEAEAMARRKTIPAVKEATS